MKRRAVLVNAPEIVESRIDKPLAPAYEPQVIEGEAFDRLKLDPEVRAFRKKLVAGAAVVGGCIALAVVSDFWLQRKAPLKVEAVAPVGTPPATELIYKDTRLTSGQASRSEVAQEAVRRFLAATSADEWLTLVDDASHWEEAIRRYVLTTPLKPATVVSMRVSGDEENTTGLTIVRAQLLNAGEVEVFVGWEKGRALIDWPSFVGWSSLPWAELMERTPRDPVRLRVLAEISDNYTNDFSDAASLLCLRLRDPMNRDSPPLFAYAQRASPAAEGLVYVLKNQSGKSKLLLSLQYPISPISRNQLWLSKVVSLNWFDRAGQDVKQATTTSR